MSNRFFTFVSRLIAGTTAKSTEVNAIIDYVENGFDAAELELNTAIKLPAAESATNQRLIPAAAARHGHFIGFDAAGALRTGASFVADWDAGGYRITNLPTAVAGTEPVTFAQMLTYATSLAGVPSITGQNGYLVTNGTTVVWQSTLVPITTTQMGAGFASPKVILGDATATTACYDLRSTTGSQIYDARIKSTGGTNGTVGKGSLSVECASLAVTGPIGFASEYDAGNSGASKTISFLNGSRQKLTLNAATPAITVSAPPVVGHYQIKLVQNGTQAAVPTWVGFNAVDCVGNAFPVVTTATNGVTFIYLYYDGTQFWVTSSAWD